MSADQSSAKHHLTQDISVDPTTGHRRTAQELLADARARCERRRRQARTTVPADVADLARVLPPPTRLVSSPTSQPPRNERPQRPAVAPQPVVRHARPAVYGRPSLLRRLVLVLFGEPKARP